MTTEKRTLEQCAADFLKIQREINGFQKGKAGRGYKYCSLPEMKEKIMPILEKYGFYLLSGCDQIHNGHCQQGQATYGRFWAKAIPNEYPDCEKFMTSGWFNLSGCANPTKSGGWTMGPAQENGGANAYALKYLWANLFSAPMSEHDPDEPSDEDKGHMAQQQNRETAQQAQNEYQNGGAPAQQQSPPPQQQSNAGNNDYPISDESANRVLDDALDWCKKRQFKQPSEKEQKYYDFAFNFIFTDSEHNGKQYKAFGKNYFRQPNQRGENRKYMPSMKQLLTFAKALKNLGSETFAEEVYSVYQRNGGTENL